MSRHLIVLGMMLLSSGCATYRPVVDIHDREEAIAYERDLHDCQRYARSVDPVASAVAGAFVGALIGAAIGGAVGDHSLALDTARVGAVEGGVVGAAGGAGTQVDIIRNCLAERGYSVLH